MLTLACDMAMERNKGAKPDVRTVYLNGISVDLLEQRTDGTITVHVRSGDTRLTTDVRYCADSIVLPDLHGYQGTALTLAAHKTLEDRPLRNPDAHEATRRGSRKYWFSPPTQFTVAVYARMELSARRSFSCSTAR
ncbi:MAG: hypothetical protein IPI05_16740 [Flavobacteriales bacterium]|nr:hypothetical protein [Flavobacteriales bacterium]